CCAWRAVAALSGSEAHAAARGRALPLAVGAAGLRDVAAALLASGDANARATSRGADEGTVGSVRPLACCVARLRRETGALFRSGNADAGACARCADERTDLRVGPLSLSVADLFCLAIA